MTIRSSRYGGRPILSAIKATAEFFDPNSTRPQPDPVPEEAVDSDPTPPHGITRTRPKLYAVDSATSPMAQAISSGIKAAVTGRDMGEAMDSEFVDPDPTKAIKRPRLPLEKTY